MARPYLVGLVVAPIFCWITVWNGYPIVYEDTQSYLERPATLGAMFGIPNEWASQAKLGRLQPPASKAAAGVDGGFDHTFKSGRSIYYGIPAYVLNLFGGLWAVVGAQAIVLGVVLALLWYRCLGLTSHAGFAALVGIMAVATSAGLFVNLVMPDVLSGILILTFGMVLVFWSQLYRTDRVVLLLISELAVISHDSNLLLGAAILCVGGLAWLLSPMLRQGGIGGRALGAGALVLGGGLLAGAGFVLMVHLVTGQVAAKLPHLTAHLVSKPVLAEFLADNCGDPTPRWVVCAYRHQLPIVWTVFLFEAHVGKGTFGTASSVDKLRISQQDLPLMIAVFRARPIAMTKMLATDSALQLAEFSYADLSPRTKSTFIKHNFPLRVQKLIYASQLWHDDWALWRLSAIEQGVVMATLPLLAIALFGVWRTGTIQSRAILLLCGLVCIGVVANAVICGSLASPYDRFQARVIWLVPLMAFVSLIASVWPLPADVLPLVED